MCVMDGYEVLLPALVCQMLSVNPEASLVNVVRYLRGGRHLCIPNGWRSTIHAACELLRGTEVA